MVIRIRFDFFADDFSQKIASYVNRNNIELLEKRLHWPLFIFNRFYPVIVPASWTGIRYNIYQR